MEGGGPFDSIQLIFEFIIFLLNCRVAHYFESFLSFFIASRANLVLIEDFGQ